VLENMFAANPDGVTETLNRASVFIAGCGGLGSNVANILVRAGVRNISMADFDVVCASNLNRQFFFKAQIGVPKVKALKDNLLAIDPDLQLYELQKRLCPENFSDCIGRDFDLVFECFDNAAAKAELTRFMLRERRDSIYVAVSGLAGIAPVENIRVIRRSKNFILVGDGGSDADESGTFASRVIAAAAIQAHCGIMALLERA
jgi:sulfur carrier protein ThiS adenylyltransferase